MTILYAVMLFFLAVFIIGSRYIHQKRTGNYYVDSYLWFVKLLK